MSRYEAMFARLRAKNEGAFCPFLMLGDPDLARSEVLLDALVEGGADMIEVGIPFSDPIADGPTVQAVVCGSTNFSWRGLYVQANHAVIWRGASVLTLKLD